MKLIIEVDVDLNDALEGEELTEVEDQVYDGIGSVDVERAIVKTLHEWYMPYADSLKGISMAVHYGDDSKYARTTIETRKLKKLRADLRAARKALKS